MGGAPNTRSCEASHSRLRSPTGPRTLTIEGLTLSYRDRVILNDIDLDVAAGESVSVIGPGGAGKSSLLSAIMGLIEPDRGSISIDGVIVSGASSSATSRLRRDRVGVILQAEMLLPELSPLENVILAGLVAGMSPGEAHARATDLLTACGVPLEERSVTEFSGIERQRVAVARSLVNRPDLVLADEPTGLLDPPARDQLIDLLLSLPGQFNCALIVVTPDPAVAGCASRQMVLDEGQLTEREGRP